MPTIVESRQLLTTREAGDVLGVSSRRIRQLIAEGRLDALWFGRDYLIEPGNLRAVIRRPYRKSASKS